MTKTTEYCIWTLMIQRCTNPNSRAFHNYGGRGIAVCDRWRHSFEAFHADMGARPSREYTLDRIDNNGPYAPENCRWATWRQQANNTRKARLLTHGGHTRSVAEWARATGISARTIITRLNQLHWPVHKTLTTPPRHYATTR